MSMVGESLILGSWLPFLSAAAIRRCLWGMFRAHHTPPQWRELDAVISLKKWTSACHWQYTSAANGMQVKR
jgi:hypothetical protein